MRRALAVALGALLLTGCSAGGGGASADPPTPTPTPSAVSPSSAPSPTVSPSPESEFAAEVDELYTLVKTSVEGSGDPASSSEVLKAFATTVGLLKVAPEQEADRTRVVDAAESAAGAHETVARIPNSVERSAALVFARQQLQALEVAIRTLPGAAPAVP